MAGEIVPCPIAPQRVPGGTFAARQILARNSSRALAPAINAGDFTFEERSLFRCCHRCRNFALLPVSNGFLGPRAHPGLKDEGGGQLSSSPGCLDLLLSRSLHRGPEHFVRLRRGGSRYLHWPSFDIQQWGVASFAGSTGDIRMDRHPPAGALIVGSALGNARNKAVTSSANLGCNSDTW